MIGISGGDTASFARNCGTWHSSAPVLSQNLETDVKTTTLGRTGLQVSMSVSNYDAAQMAEFSATQSVETLQPPYHSYRREIEDAVLPYCSAHNIGVLVYRPLAHGLLTGTMSYRPPLRASFFLDAIALGRWLGVCGDQG
jgi:diketogulonate reductase-like aldo/keto reductase